MTKPYQHQPGPAIRHNGGADSPRGGQMTCVFDHQPRRGRASVAPPHGASARGRNPCPAATRKSRDATVPDQGAVATAGSGCATQLQRWAQRRSARAVAGHATAPCKSSPDSRPARSRATARQPRMNPVCMNRAKPLLKRSYPAPSPAQQGPNPRHV